MRYVHIKCLPGWLAVDTDLVAGVMHMYHSDLIRAGVVNGKIDHSRNRVYRHLINIDAYNCKRFITELVD